ncbi:MAG TPA: hypothetical protein VHR66_00730, partial [Gemmataceae bacterium]|nr:hypothetical protein [Gemmataceae bacterium]
DEVLAKVEAIEEKLAAAVVETRDTVTPAKTFGGQPYGLVRRYVCKGRQVRRDTYHELPNGQKELIDTFVLSDDRLLQYDPARKVAHIRQTDDREFAIATDFRRIAIRPPVGGIADWLRRAKVLSLSIDGTAPAREVWVTVEEPSKGEAPAGHTVELVLAEHVEFLPTKVTYRSRRDNRVRSTVEVQYDRNRVPLPAPAEVTMEFFDSTGKSTGSFQLQVIRCDANPQVVDTEFDPVLPPGTALGGNLSASPNVGKTPTPVSQVSIGEPQARAPGRVWEVSRARAATLLVANGLMFVVAIGLPAFLARRAPRSGPLGAYS